MKLLSKSDITIHKVRERQQSIDDGMKIAHRVDNLRKVMSDEEKALEKFRKENTAIIQKEISDKKIELDNLKSEVAVLEQRKSKALEPIEALWEEVRNAHLQIKEGELVLKEIQKRLSEHEESLQKKETDADFLFKRAKLVETQTEQELRDAIQKNELAESALKSAHEVFSNVSDQCAKRERAVSIQEESLMNYDKNLEQRETLLAEDQKKLENGWRLLRDREQMLERSLKRK